MKKLLFFLAVSVMLMSCTESVNQQQASSSGARAAQVNQLYSIPKNSKGLTVEQQNIMDRIRVTHDPTKILWMHIISNLTGKMIMRVPVRNKITSSGKRLEPTSADGGGTQYSRNLPNTPNGDYQTTEIIQPDGTFGSSDAYVFWFDPMGRYHQLGSSGGMSYLLTDYPIDIADPVDEVTGLYKAHLAAQEWQKSQEKQLISK